MSVLEPCILAPIEFAAPDPVVRVIVGGVEQDCTLDIPSGTEQGPFFASGDGGADDIIEILLDALNALPGGVTWTKSLSVRNVLTLTCSSACTLKWAHANTTIDPAIFGFEEANTSSATSHVGAFMTRGCWIPGLDGSPRAYREDTLDEPVTGAVVAVTLDGGVRGYDLSPESHERYVDFYRLDAGRVLASQAPSSAPYGAFETLWTEHYLAAGAAFRLYDDHTDRATYTVYSSTNPKRPWALEAIDNGARRYELKLSLMEQV